jgi:hypothetical protein
LQFFLGKRCFSNGFWHTQPFFDHTSSSAIRT